ncbi:hypothetical protein [Nocardia sp. R6R-6]|uniref:hypothetical protein n=1 Tax=Nocardia sp. R6R-6 TaxID=3459303 RepID=UPI00403E09B3
MAEDLTVQADHLRGAAKAWSDTVRNELLNGSRRIDGLKFSRLQAGIFQLPWDRYINTANYIQARLIEGAEQADRMGGALHTAANAYEQQDLKQAQQTQAITGNMDFSL